MGFWQLVNPAGTAVDLDTLGISVQVMNRTGMPPLDNTATPFAYLDGALFQSTRAKGRVFTLMLTASGSSWTNLQTIRQALINLLKPDRAATQQAVEVRYSVGGTRTLAIKAFYDGGLEGD